MNPKRTRPQPYLYPDSLVTALEESWAKSTWGRQKVPQLPATSTLFTLLNTAYHATFTIEEGRRTRFRLIFATHSELEDQSANHAAPRHATLQFDRPRAYTVQEITRLAPATDPTRVSIGVSAGSKRGELRIWGLIDSGSSWSDFVTHESSGGYPPPNFLTIGASEPGNLEISRAGRNVLSLRRGSVAKSLPALYDGPLEAFFEQAQTAVHKAVLDQLGVDRWDQTDHDEEYPQRAYVFLLERLLNRISALGHGGAVIVVPDQLEVNDTRLLDRMNVKYPGGDRRLWELLVSELALHRRYYDSHIPMWDKKTIDKAEWAADQHLNSNREEVELAQGDAVRFVAALSGVDGSVVLTDRLRLLGFGAEVTVSSPTLQSVRVVDRIDGTGGRILSIENYGTRHRAAFRMASSFESSVVFVMSQDGGIKAVKRVGPDVVLWPDLATFMS